MSIKKGCCEYSRAENVGGLLQTNYLLPHRQNLCLDRCPRPKQIDKPPRQDLSLQISFARFSVNRQPTGLRQGRGTSEHQFCLI
jgi:hypothetical protein